jgi:sugar phosphate isomerase/epimerase
MRLACSTSSFPHEALPRALARVAWAGYRAVELALGGAVPEGDAAEELAARLAANELEVAAVHAGELGARDPEEALEAAGRVGRAALLAQRLDGPRVVVEAPAAGTVEHLAAGLVTLLRVLEEVPVTLCLANRAHSMASTPAELAELRRRVPGDRLAFALDPAEAWREGWDAADALARLPERPQVVYLNDCAGPALVPPGEGEVQWPRLAAALRAAGYDGFLTLRLNGAEPWAVEPAAKEARLRAAEWFDLDDDW